MENSGVAMTWRVGRCLAKFCRRIGSSERTAGEELPHLSRQGMVYMICTLTSSMEQHGSPLLHCHMQVENFRLKIGRGTMAFAFRLLLSSLAARRSMAVGGSGVPFELSCLGF